MLELDGTSGEGGGQILRTSLSLSLLTGTPFRIRAIRGGRKKPGLLRQHLTAVNAAATVGGAEVEGAHLGSSELTFIPQARRGGVFRFAVGSAGSATLVFQTILPALLRADAPSTVTFEGGTHNAWAPPFDFLERSFLPLLQRMGGRVGVRLERHGFYPAGGGSFVADVTPSELKPLQLLERGPITARTGRVLSSGIQDHVAEREARKLRKLELSSVECVDVRDSLGPGNVCMVEFAHAATTIVTGFGARGVKAERVAGDVVKEARGWLAADVPVCEHLADQLLLPLAMAGGGAFRTVPLSMHTRTNLETIGAFLPLRFGVEEGERSAVIRVV